MNGPFPFHGVFPALITPMRDDGSLDLPALREHIEDMIAAGVHGLVPLGSTGEFYALDAKERQCVLETTIEVTDRRIPILAGTNAASTQDVIRYSAEAQELGADGLLLAPPYYSLPGPHELVEHYRRVSDAVSIPIMLYNFPDRTGVDMDVDLVEKLCDIENIQAIKESTGDVDRFRELSLRLKGRISLYCGADAIPLQCFALGATGWVAGIANVIPSEHVRLYEASVYGREDEARSLMARLLPFMEAIEHSGAYTQLVKALWAKSKGRCPHPRMPLLPPSRELLASAYALLLQVTRIDGCQSPEL